MLWDGPVLHARTLISQQDPAVKCVVRTGRLIMLCLMEQGWTREKGVGLLPRRDQRRFFSRYALLTRILSDFFHCFAFVFRRVQVHMFVDAFICFWRTPLKNLTPAFVIKLH